MIRSGAPLSSRRPKPRAQRRGFASPRCAGGQARAGRHQVLLLALSVSLATSAAAAAPLKASIDTSRIAPLIAECKAEAPGVGRVFEGTVLQVIDGQTVCLAQGPPPAEWIRVTIAGAPRDSSRGTLMAAAFGQVLDCVAMRAMPAGVEARCEVNGASLERLIATDAARRDGLSWR
jgi:micrococcal nuclease